MTNTIKTARVATTSEEQRQRNHERALEDFIRIKTEIDELLQRLAAASDDHFGFHPDSIHFGHVGTLGHYRALLRRITDSHFGEGEHADG